MIGRNIGVLAVTHAVPVFSEPGEYMLDTLDIDFVRQDYPSYRKGLIVETSPGVDSMHLLLPDRESLFQAKFVGTVAESGELRDRKIEYVYPEMDSITGSLFMERVGSSRFYLQERYGDVSIIIY